MAVGGGGGTAPFTGPWGWTHLQSDSQKRLCCKSGIVPEVSAQLTGSVWSIQAFGATLGRQSKGGGAKFQVEPVGARQWAGRRGHGQGAEMLRQEPESPRRRDR